MKVSFYRNTAYKVLNVINNDIKVSNFDIKEPEVINCLKMKTKEIIRIVKEPGVYSDIIYQVIFNEDWFYGMGNESLDYFEQMEVIVRNKHLDNMIYVEFQLISKRGKISNTFSFPRILYQNCVLPNNADFDFPHPKTRYVNCMYEGDLNGFARS